jgi:hypothetical protein
MCADERQAERDRGLCNFNLVIYEEAYGTLNRMPVWLEDCLKILRS